MQRIIALLEKYVEWVALGIGAVFFLLVTWMYLQPVALPVHFGSETQVTIGNVDDKIDKGPAEDLRRKISQAVVPKFTVEKFGDRIASDLAMKDAGDAPVTAAVWDQQPWKPDIKINPVGQPGQQVQDLPALPAAIPLAVIVGTSTVDAPATGILGNAAAAPVAGAAPAAPLPQPQPPGQPLFPGMPNPGPMGGPPFTGPGPGGGVPMAPAVQLTGGVRTDVVWNTVLFVIPADPLIKQWNASFGPNPKVPNSGWLLQPIACQTAVLDVKLIREVKNGDSWQADPTTGDANGAVPRLFNDILQPIPAAVDRTAVGAYFAYAKAQVALITAPPFATQSTAPSGTRIADPTTFLQQLLTAAPKPVTTPGVSAPPYEPASPAEPIVLASPNVHLAAQPVVLADGLNPADATLPPKDILVWLHDTTTMPGRVYRYKLSYRLLNPLYFAALSVAKNPNWTQQVTLDSPDSPPSVEVTSHARVRYFCAPSIVLNDACKFDVFAWANGALHKHQFTVNCGDVIGGKVDESTTESVDYSTGVTLVYVHNSNNRARVITADPDGRINVRDAQTDRDDAQRHWLDAQIAAVKPVTPGPGTTPPMPMMPNTGPNYVPPVFRPPGAPGR